MSLSKAMQKVVLHDGQYEVATDTHRFRIVCAGRRWGKSVLSELITLQWACKNVGLYWIISPTYRQSKQIFWRGLQQIIPPKWIVKKNEVELSITITNGSIIELKGAENPDALRGVKLRGLVIDEIASIRNWDWLWQEVLRPTLTDYEAPCVFISTPKGYNHFYELYTHGQEASDTYKSWRFTSYDNPYIPKGEIDKEKQELTEDTFAQEFLADFRKHTGLVYKEFEHTLHVIKPFDIPQEWEIYCGVDFGRGGPNPTAITFIATDNEYNFFVVDEIYQSALLLDELAGRYNSNTLRSRIISAWCDPSSPDWIKELEWRKVYLTPANKQIGQQFNSWVSFGIEKVREKLKPTPGHGIPILQPNGMFTRTIEQGLPSLFVFNTCVHTIQEFETYRWKEKSPMQAEDLNEPDVPEKANDHAMDAIRYFMVSYKKSANYVLPADDISNANWGLETSVPETDISNKDWII